MFLGRLDHQTKVRGYRVEAGEIEVVLERFPGVERALVMVRNDTSDNNELIAYVESHGAEMDCEALRSHLADWLPTYMLPRQIEILLRFPLLPNGKVDRSCLPQPGATPNTVNFEAPRN